ncbi:MAG TPA: pilus assembly protein TadG-related protein [Rhizomicrobium sp.]|nr:pilus assembly protein TadG-related protein [Rhizomicrobium sp.]
MIYALSLIPITVAAGAGLDLGRAMVVRARLAEALDAAGLAVGATSGLTTSQMQTMAQQYFNANYTADSTFGTPAAVSVTTANQQITLTTSVQMPTTLMNVVGIKTVSVGYTSNVVWGQTKLWVSLVLDNTGSMTETDSTGTSKISALKTASDNLLTTLQSVAANPGDVEVAIVPFSKDVNLGTSYSGSSWLDWTDWEAAPPSSTPGSSVGPGSSCPYGTNTSPYGYRCTTGPSNGSSSTSTIPSSGSYKGYICPGQDNGNYNTGRGGHYYNGCYNSTPTQTLTTTTTQSTPKTVKYNCTTVNGGSPSCSQSSSSTGSTTTNTTTSTSAGYTGDSTSSSTSSSSSTSDGSQSCSTHHGTTTCTYTETVVTTTVVTTVTKTGTAPYTHSWVVNDHSTWGGCIEDRTQDYDVDNTAPTSTSTNFPPENTPYCPPSTMSKLSYDWTSLKSAIDNMSASGSTNQPIGLDWGWVAQSSGDPFDAGAVPANTTQVLIILSDGLNTQDRWYGDGSNQSTSVDARMTLVCQKAKTAGFTIYAVFVDLNGTQGNSTVLQNCATDLDHYFDLTTSGAIVTAFNTIATQITQLRVAQ